MRVAIITASTAIYREQEEDASGKLVKQTIEAAGHNIVFMKALPCDETVLSTVMQRMSDGHLTDLILTIGGTGCAAGDCTPEATRASSAGYSGGDACLYASADQACYAEPVHCRHPRRCNDR